MLALILIALLPVVWGSVQGADAAVFQVTSDADGGVGSLREAIAAANVSHEQNVVEFASSVKEIQLFSTVTITGQVVINGHGAIVRGSRVTRLFSVSSGGSAAFDSLTFSDGYTASESGGAVYIDSTAGGKADFVNCTFFGNRAGRDGGAVCIYGGGAEMTTFTFCTLTGNEANGNGGGVAILGGTVVFNASIVTGNGSVDIYSEGSGLVSNSGRFNVIGQTNAAPFFASSRGNFLSVSPSDVFKTPGSLTEVEGVNVVELLSATSNVALDAVSRDVAVAMKLPDVDERGAARPQMTAADAGAYELSPVALTGLEVRGGSYIQRGTIERYDVSLRPENVTLDVRGYEDGIEWTVINPSYGEVISVDRYGQVTGVSLGDATVCATAHGWNAGGESITITATKSVSVGENPLPVPTVTVSFVSPKTTMEQRSRQTLKLALEVNPSDTPCTISFVSDYPSIASVVQSEAGSTATLEAKNLGQTAVRVLVTAVNSKGTSRGEDVFILTVEESKHSGGGGCSAGWGILALLPAALVLPKRGRTRR
ncbi:MAG: hypothetical protein LBR61_00225 [Synergistaceae bacterium]|jgi:hypothetical protein|nr:hypothetical protein [Synergistaceae bacterium]